MKQKLIEAIRTSDQVVMGPRSEGFNSGLKCAIDLISKHMPDDDESLKDFCHFVEMTYDRGMLSQEGLGLTSENTHKRLKWLSDLVQEYKAMIKQGEEG